MRYVISLIFTAAAIAAPTPVRSESELRKAAAIAATQPAAVILIDGPIKISAPVTLGGETLTLLGVGAKAELQFTNPFRCDWSKPPPNNGLDCTANTLFIENIRFSNYDWWGSTIKWNADPAASKLLFIDHCRFTECGSHWCPGKVTPSATSDDAHASNVIGAHEHLNATIVVTDCTFTRCANAQQVYGHCIYAAARRLAFTNNTFNACGNPFQTGYSNRTWQSDQLVTGNTITAGPPAKDNSDKVRPPYFFVVGAHSNNVVVRNTLKGEWQLPYTGYPSLNLQLIGFNDWTGAKLTEPFAVDLWNAKYVSGADWRGQYETGSVWPQ